MKAARLLMTKYWRPGEHVFAKKVATRSAGPFDLILIE